MPVLPGGGAAPSVLFVCTANISRSPYAQRRSQALVAELGAGALLCDSAGTPGHPGRPMDPAMARELASRGIDPEHHVSRAVDEQILSGADLVLTFEFAHMLRLLERWPRHADRVYGIRQFVDALGRIDPRARGRDAVAGARDTASPNSMTWDVDDPYGAGSRAARRCAEQIDALAEVLVPRLVSPVIGTSEAAIPR